MTGMYLPNKATLGPIHFNDVDANGVYWFAEKIDGWGSPKGTLTVTQKPRAHGGWRSESFLTPRIIVVGGTIQAPSPGALATARHALNAAVSLSDTTFSVTEYGETLTATVTRQDEVLYGDETETWTTFSIQLVAEDPRRYGPVISQSTFMPSSSGGLTLPLTIPFTISGVVTNGTIGIVNPGNVTSGAKMRIDGPVVGPIITDVGSGNQLVLSSSYSLSTGNWLDIDPEARTIRENGQASRIGYLTSRGWPTFDPGNNTYGFNGVVYNSSGKLTVTVYPSYL